ncbi:hypothetical protein [Tunturiibacter gelidiferens]|uniref:hypothetical protein n=1 Tax=Tunturiibacter gelidiferens TaxID=3069689 RepID=UPI003D9BD299
MFQHIQEWKIGVHYIVYCKVITAGGSLVPTLQAYAKNQVIFFQGQLRYIAPEVLRLQPMSSEELPSPENHQLGELLLRAGELLYQRIPPPSKKYDSIANTISWMLPIYEIDSPIDAMVQFLRFYISLTVSIPRMPEHLRIFRCPRALAAASGNSYGSSSPRTKSDQAGE